MAQAMQVGTFEAPISMDKKTYSVSFKGLIAHFLDILFGKYELSKLSRDNKSTITGTVSMP